MTEAREPSGHTHLLVPMYLEALVVGEHGLQQITWTDQTPDFSRIEDEQGLGKEIVPRLFEDTPAPYPPGVHLHWALPAAFTHARPPSDTSTAAPSSRWYPTAGLCSACTPLAQGNHWLHAPGS